MLGVPLVLWVTHGVVAVLSGFTGGLVVYLTMRRRANREEPMSVQTRQNAKTGIGVVLLCLAIVTFGIQLHAAHKDDARRHVQQMCLNRFSVHFAAYFTGALNTRAAANARLTAAQKRLTEAALDKDDATDDVIETVAKATDHPPTATSADFLAALQRFRVAKAHLVAVTAQVARVEREAKATLDSTGTPTKPYDPPKVACLK